MQDTLQRYRARQQGDDREVGFTLIELLIVIVVLGILAAVTVFALSGVTSTSAKAACKSDGATVNTALVSYNATTGGTPVATDNSVVGTPSNLVKPDVAGGPTYLQSWPISTHYKITLVSGVVTVTPNFVGAVAAAWTSGTACDLVV